MSDDSLSMFASSLDRFISRSVLISMLLGASLGKIIEKLNGLLTTTDHALLALWTIEALLFLGLFIIWPSIDPDSPADT